MHHNDSTTRPVTHRLVRYSNDAELHTEANRLFQELTQTKIKLNRSMRAGSIFESRQLANDMAILSGQLGLFLREMERRQNQQVPEPLSEAEKALLPLL
jgi:hypothetical protein